MADAMNVAVTAVSAGQLTVNVFTDRLVSTQSQDVKPGVSQVEIVSAANDWARRVSDLRKGPST